MSEMNFKDASEFDRFSTVYRNHLMQGMASDEALAAARKEFWPEESLSEQEREAYRKYVSVNGLSPEEALHLVKMKKDAPKEKDESKKEPAKDERKASLLDVSKWYNDWAGNAWKSWMDRFEPLNGFFDDGFFKNFERDFFDWGSFDRAKKLGCSCGCKDKKKDASLEEKKAAQTPAKPVDKAVENEVKKVLDTLPKDEVSDTNTKVKILKSDPNDYEFKVEHNSPDGSRFSSYTRRYIKS